MRSLRLDRGLPFVKVARAGARNGLHFPQSLRQLHTTPRYRTDGVYQDLTNMRVRTPWVEALREQREKAIDPTEKSSTPATPSDRDLNPKKMSDSFHRVARTSVPAALA